MSHYRRPSGVGPGSFQELIGWDSDVSYADVLFAFFVDAGFAASIGALLFFAIGSLPAAAGVAAVVWAASAVVLRGLSSASLGDRLNGLGYERARDAGRPGVIRCGVHEALTLVGLPVTYFIIEDLLTTFAGRLAGLHVYKTR